MIVAPRAASHGARGHEGARSGAWTWYRGGGVKGGGWVDGEESAGECDVEEEREVRERSKDAARESQEEDDDKTDDDKAARRV